VQAGLIMEVITWVLGTLAVLVFTRQVLIRLGIVLGILDTGPALQEMAVRKPKTLAEAMRGAMVTAILVKE
jgi:hypothetical protein